MNTKKIENKGIEKLREFLREKYHIRQEDIKDVHKQKCGYDVEIKYNGKTYYIEVKTSQNEPGCNISFTHQTITKMYENKKLRNMIVALVYNLSTKPEFYFFKFGYISQKEILPELSFNVHYSFIRTKKIGSKEIPFTKKPSKEDNIKNILNKRVKDYIKLKNKKTK